MGFSAIQPSEPLGSFTRNEGLQSQTYELRLYPNAGESCCALDKLAVKINRRTHVHQYAWVRQSPSSLALGPQMHSYYPATVS